METEYENPSVVPQANTEDNGAMQIEEAGPSNENVQQNTDNRIDEGDERDFAEAINDSQTLSNVMKTYYENIFPFELLEKWLRYGNDPKSKRPDIEKGYFAKREISFTLENDAYLRNQYSYDWEELKKKVVKYTPSKIDIGAVFKASPKCGGVYMDDEENPMQTPEEREFVIDIDMDDYNNVRTCCANANICDKCWKFMKEAHYVIDMALRDDFGFDHIVWLFSGRRGVHAWVCDQRARQMSNEIRGSVAEYLRVVSGNDKAGIKVEKVEFKSFPHIQRSFDRLRKKFVEIVIEDQKLFEIPERVNQVIEFVKERVELGEDSMGNLRKILKNTSSPDFYIRFEDEILKLAAIAEEKKGTPVFPLEELIFFFLYPRIDINVSKGMNHLLKSPFCVHPKSKKLSVPVLDMNTFNPEEVPKLEDLITIRGDGKPIFNKVPIQPYIDFFENFIHEIEEDTKRIQREERMEQREEQERDLEF